MAMGGLLLQSTRVANVSIHGALEVGMFNVLAIQKLFVKKVSDEMADVGRERMLTTAMADVMLA